RRRWADAATMNGQMDHLLAMSDRPNIMVQVLPFDAPPERQSPISSHFTLISVPSPGAAGPLQLAYTEGEGEIRYLDDRKALKAHERAWSRVTAAALSFSESRKLIQHAGDEFKEKAQDR